MGTQRIDIIINGKNSLSNALRSASSDVKKFGSDAETSGKKFSQNFKNIDTDVKNVHKSVKGLTGAFGGLAGVLGGVLSGYTLYDMVTSAIQANKEWRKFFANQHIDLAKQTDLMNSQKAAIYGMAQEYGFYTADVRSSMSEFIQRGQDFNTALIGTQDAMMLASATTLDLADAGKLLAQSQTEGGERAIKRIMKETGLTKEQITNEEGKVDLLELQTNLREKYADTLEAQGKSDEANLIRAENSWNKIKTTIGSLVSGPLALLAQGLQFVADKFNELTPEQKTIAGWAAIAAIIGTGLLGAVAGFRTALDAATGKRRTAKVKIDCEKDDDCDCSNKKGGFFGTKGGKGGAGATTFLGGLSLIPALTGTSKAAAAGMTASGWAGTALGAEILGLAYGGGMNYADTNLSGNAGYNIIRTAQLSSFGGLLRPFQAQAGLVSDLVGGKGLSASLSNYAQNMNPTKGIQDIWSNYFNVKKKIENNPITPLANTKATLTKLGSEPQKAWEKAKKLVTGNPIKGKADANTSGLTKVSPMWNAARGVVQRNPIIGRVGVTGNPAGTVASLIAAAQRVATNNPIIVKMFARKQGSFNPLAGPAGPSSFLSQASGGFRYESYGGSRQGIMDTLSCLSGNCVDGTLAQMSLASAFGIPSEMVATTWNGNPHVYAKIGGRSRDIANHALTGSWSAPPRGPGGSGNYYDFRGATIMDWNSFKNHVERATNEIVRW